MHARCACPHCHAVEPRGAAITLDSADTHAWVARTLSGVTVLELPPEPGRPSRHFVDVAECEIAGQSAAAGAAAEAPVAPLHQGWR